MNSKHMQNTKPMCFHGEVEMGYICNDDDQMVTMMAQTPFLICWLLAVVRFVAWWSYKKKLSANIANCRKITVPPSFAKPHCRHVASLGSLDCAVTKCVHFNVLNIIIFKSWKNMLCQFLNKRTISCCVVNLNWLPVRISVQKTTSWLRQFPESDVKLLQVVVV